MMKISLFSQNLKIKRINTSYKLLFNKRDTGNNNHTFSTKEKDSQIVFNNTKDVKAFGKKFSEEELKKYLDPYGFLNSTKDKDVIAELKTMPAEPEIKTSLKEDNSDQTNKNEEYVKKLEEIEKIDDPKLKADEKCKSMPEEFGYKYKGPEPTRYGDWEIKGKCVDF